MAFTLIIAHDTFACALSTLTLGHHTTAREPPPWRPPHADADNHTCQRPPQTHATREVTPKSPSTSSEKPKTTREPHAHRPQKPARPLPPRTPTRHGQPCSAERTKTPPQRAANRRCHSHRQPRHPAHSKARHSTRQNTQDDGTRSRHTIRQSAARQQQETGQNPQSQQAATYKPSLSLTNVPATARVNAANDAAHRAQ